MTDHDEIAYQSFLEYRKRIGMLPLTKEDWMRRREEPIRTPEQKVKEFLDTQIHARGESGLISV